MLWTPRTPTNLVVNILLFRKSLSSMKYKRSIVFWNPQTKATVRNALLKLPAPRNDYEIVVPEFENAELQQDSAADRVEDQADVEARRHAEVQAKRM